MKTHIDGHTAHRHLSTWCDNRGGGAVINACIGINRPICLCAFSLPACFHFRARWNKKLLQKRALGTRSAMVVSPPSVLLKMRMAGVVMFVCRLGNARSRAKSHVRQKYRPPSILLPFLLPCEVQWLLSHPCVEGYEIRVVSVSPGVYGCSLFTLLFL